LITINAEVQGLSTLVWRRGFWLWKLQTQAPERREEISDIWATGL